MTITEETVDQCLHVTIPRFVAMQVDAFLIDIAACQPILLDALSTSVVRGFCFNLRPYFPHNNFIESLDLVQCSRQTSPVCDVLNNQHNTLCSFLRTNEEFNYFGFCEVSRLTTIKVNVER